MVTKEQLEFFEENGYLIVRDFLSETEVKDLQDWAQQVHDWPATPESDFMPYEVGLAVRGRSSKQTPILPGLIR